MWSCKQISNSGSAIGNVIDLINVRLVLSGGSLMQYAIGVLSNLLVAVLCFFVIILWLMQLKQKVSGTKAFLRVLKYSTGGVLEVIAYYLFQYFC